MFMIVLVGLGLIVADESPATAPKPADAAAYRAAAEKAGKDAGSQVRLALWCEAHGMTAERMKHLAAAITNDPANALAHGLMGMVDFRGKWERPEDVSREAKEDPRLKTLRDEYFQRRAKTPDKADDQWKLAAWCEQHGLKEEAVAHYHAVLRLDPRREAAWKHLGFKKVGRHWVKPEQQEAAKRESEEQNRANKHWKPFLERLRSGLASRDKARRETAEAELLQVTDPRAVPMVWAVFVPKGAHGQETAVRILAQIDAPGSSRALAMLALSSKSGKARGEATQILRQRDPRDFAPMLVSLIRDPIKYEIKPVNGPGKPGELVIHDGTTKRERIYTPLSEPNIPLGPNDRIVMGPDGLPVVDRMIGFTSMNLPSTPNNINFAFGLTPPGYASPVAGMLQRAGVSAAISQKIGAMASGPTPAQYRNEVNAIKAFDGVPQSDPGYINITSGQFLQIPIGDMELDAQRSVQVARMQLSGDVQAIEAYNAPIRETNRRTRQVLSEAIGVDQGDDRGAWTRWMVDLFGYAISAQKSSADETTVIEQVPIDYQPQAPPVGVQSQVMAVKFMHSCFGAGTPVHTLDGPRPIEVLRVGDLVLTQNPRTGELSYQAIVTAYHNPPNGTFRVTLETGESIVATGIHRLWKAGHGWTMVRDLKPSDLLRTLGGVAAIRSVEPDRVQPVFNLKVADGESYFVGETSVLAHDNSTINPVTEPFDAVGALVVEPSRPTDRPRSMLGR